MDVQMVSYLKLGGAVLEGATVGARPRGNRFDLGEAGIEKILQEAVESKEQTSDTTLPSCGAPDCSNVPCPYYGPWRS